MNIDSLHSVSSSDFIGIFFLSLFFSFDNFVNDGCLHSSVQVIVDNFYGAKNVEHKGKVKSTFYLGTEFIIFVCYSSVEMGESGEMRWCL